MSAVGTSDGRFQNIGNGLLAQLVDSVEHLHVGSPVYDAFSRIRVSNPVTLFESKLVVAEGNLLWDVGQVSGSGGSFTYSRNRASVVIRQPALTAGRYVRRTRRYFNYQPGKSQLIVLTCVPGESVDGVHKRMGYFDDSNGIYFGVNGESIYIARRSNVTGTPVEEIVHQENWNIDKFDGNGPSGITLDTTLVQVFWMDMEWLGAGRVRWGMFYRGIPYVAHEFIHSNEPGNTSVYMSTPVLPVSFEIENDGSGQAAELEQICCTVVSEGGNQTGFITRSISRGLTSIGVTSSNLVPVISLRARTGFEWNNILIDTIDVLTTTKNPFEWQLILNPTIAGVDAASWVPVLSSTAEYDISRTEANFVTAGIVLDGGYVSDTVKGIVAKPSTFLGIGKPLLPSSPKDEYVIAVRNIAGNNTFYAGVTYEESV